MCTDSQNQHTGRIIHDLALSNSAGKMPWSKFAPLSRIIITLSRCISEERYKTQDKTSGADNYLVKKKKKKILFQSDIPFWTYVTEASYGRSLSLNQTLNGTVLQYETGKHFISFPNSRYTHVKKLYSHIKLLLR